ncbi:MAG: hypothetical protein IJ327_00940 [Lachnospiraceae bacterium]|nr:hypothetical protein [Lachnospiraceae bacterium]
MIDNQLEQNPGIARHFDYDSIILGSSMTTNFDTLLFDNQLGTQTVKLSYNAAFPGDIDKIMNVVLEDPKEINHIFLCIDIANYLYYPNTLSFVYPEHLYDQNPLNDLNYLLNKDVFIPYVIGNYVKKENTPINEAYWHWQYMYYGRQYVLKRYSAPEYKDTANPDYNLEHLKTNLEQCILPHIEATPKTQWHVFFPPYSMLYWYDNLATKDAKTRIDGMAYVTERLLTYDNVDIHYFQDMEEWICNLDNYADITHFSKQISDEITTRLCSETNVVTSDTYMNRLDAFEEFVYSFDYDTFLSQPQ